MAKLSQRNVGNNSNNAIDINSSSHIITKKASPLKAKRTRKTIPRDSPPQRSSIYRGVTKHRWTGRYEAHLWDKNCWNESQKKKGRQVYLGAYDQEEAAAHAYDLAALKYWGTETILNFPLTTYQTELKDMEGLSREEYIGSLRRKSSGFSRGVSKYRGVARHHHNGRWEARIGRVFGNKYLYLGTYATQEEAAVAYDMAAIEYRGLNAITNFDLSRYIKWLKPNDNNTNNVLQNSNPSPHNETKLNTITPNIELETNYYHQHGQQQITELDVIPVLSEPTTATSALALLLQSSKYKEMIEMTSNIESSPCMVQEAYIPQYFVPEEIKADFEPQNFRAFGGGECFFEDLGLLIFDA